MPLRRPARTGTLLMLIAAGATAQVPPPAPGDDPMARARRQAENPMRRILEASRITVRRPAAAAVAAAEPAASAPPAWPVSPVSPVPPVPPAPPAPAPTAEIRVTAEPILPAPAPSPAPAPALPAPAADPAADDAGVAAPGPPAHGRPAPPPAAAVGRLPDAPVLARPVAAPAPEPVSAPRLRHLVDPVLSPRMRDDLGRVEAVVVDLQVDADGRVREADVVTRVPPAVRRVLLAAVRQWQYEPMPQPTVHRVELVFER